MDYFNRKGSALYCESIPLSFLANKYGTPLYVYSLRTFVRHLTVVSQAFGNLPPGVIYSAKANSNLTLLRVAAGLGCGCDVVSLGEYLAARKAGISKIIFSGVGKRPEEIEYALKHGLLFFGVESENELKTIEKIARRIGKKAPISLRINPDVDPQTHPHIATGLRKEKFGIRTSTAEKLYLDLANSRFLDPVGISMHIGSQIVGTGPYIEAAEKIREIYCSLMRKKVLLKYIDLGGGWAVPFYRKQKVAMPADYVRAMLPQLKGLKADFLIEPGRAIVGNAGVLLTKAINIKRGFNKTFAIVDAAMNDFIRPALYHAEHRLEPVRAREKSIIEKYDIVGPICENADAFARGIILPQIREGDLLCLFTAGAYGYSMSSNYNSRLRPAEILVDGDKDFLIRERESYNDLWRRQRLININPALPPQ